MINLIIETHDGKTYEKSVDTYDSVAINDQLNNNELNTVVFGDLVISRINVKSITPIE